MCESRVLAVGPPLLNLHEVVENGTLLLDGRRSTTASMVIKDVDRASLWVIDAKEPFSTLTLHLEDLEATATVGHDLSDRFRGTRCLVTMSKNNDLVWIRDWLTFHVKEQGVDAVLIYDNDSDAYDLADLEREVSAVKGVRVAQVVAWRFPIGPQAGSSGLWDSNFSQHGALEHAHRRLLRQARGVLNADVDELVPREDGASVFDLAEGSPHGVLLYRGRWIENTSPACPPGVARHHHFKYTNPTFEDCPTKWCCAVARTPQEAQWTIHRVESVQEQETDRVLYRHFKAVSTHWKYPRPPVQFDPDVFVEDAGIVEAFRRTFPCAIRVPVNDAPGRHPTG